MRSGVMTIQSLTANHPPDLRKLSDADVVHELTLSRTSLQYHLGHKIYALVYPEDNYDERLEKLAAANGYELAFIEDWGSAGDSANLLEIHRYSALTRFDQALTDVGPLLNTTLLLDFRPHAPLVAVEIGEMEAPSAGKTVRFAHDLAARCDDALR